MTLRVSLTVSSLVVDGDLWYITRNLQPVHFMRATVRMTGLMFALIALCAVPAQAQLRGILGKAAKKAAENKVEDKVESATAKPLGGDPVTAETLDALLKGLSLEMETREKTKQLLTTIEAKAKEVTEAERAAGSEPDAWHRASRDVERCISNSLDKSNKQHEKELPQKMQALMTSASSNSAVIAKLQAVGKAMSDAQAKGDTPAYVKAYADYTKLLGFDIARDSAVAFAACGKLPPKPASLVKLERLEAEVARLNDERRDAEAESEARAAKAAGMPADKYALARERLWAWAAARKQKQSTRALTKDEDALFSARASDIRKIESMLR